MFLKSVFWEAQYQTVSALFDIGSVNGRVLKHENPDILKVTGSSGKKFMDDDILQSGKTDLRSGKEHFSCPGDGLSFLV